MVDTELAVEQGYFDRAADAREVRRARIRERGSMVANTWTDGGTVGTQVRRELDALGSPGSAVAVARFDLEGSSWYVGLSYIPDELGDPLVVTWQSPLVKSYYEREELLELKRVFDTNGNTIVSYIDAVRRPRTAIPTPSQSKDLEVDAPPERRPGDGKRRPARDDEPRTEPEVGEAGVVPGDQRGGRIDDALLAELERERTGQLNQVVATIQKEQYAAVSADFDGALVVQGGPGTGKTIVGLHRASYLLFNESDRLRHRRLLVVGPSGRFMSYVSKVLPSLGDADVTQASVNSLGPASSEETETDRVVASLKGDPRMAEVLARAVALQRRDPEARIVVQTRQGRASIEGEPLAEFIARRRDQPHNELRSLLRAELTAQTARSLRSTGASLGSDPGIEKVLNRLCPRLTAPELLDGLLRRRDRLRRAAEGILSVDEQNLLVGNAKDRPRGRWTASDIPLLDELEAALNGPPLGFEHLVVDEAQDLTPMQLRSLRRRCTTGSYTVLGDLAQATGVWEHADWSDLVGHLQPSGFSVAELRHSYRVPAPVLRASARLMQAIAPGLSPSLPTRPGPAPRVVRTSLERLPARTAAIVAEMVIGPGSICVVCCDADVEEVSQAVTAHKGVGSATTADGSVKVSVLSAAQVKGLEFDHTIVVEPEAIMEENDQGSRLLYVSMTRPTKSLTVVYSQALPGLLDLPAPADGDGDWSAEQLPQDHDGDTVIRDLLSQIATALPKDRLHELADRILAMANEGA